MRAFTWFLIATGLASAGAISTAFVIKQIQARMSTTTTTA
jgi:hypothetical protein